MCPLHLRRPLTIALVAVIMSLLASTPRASANNGTYHNAGYKGAPNAGNWAWLQYPNHPRINDDRVHIWWMKQYWFDDTASTSWTIMKNGDGFEMEWFNGGKKTGCDVFNIQSDRDVEIVGTGIRLSTRKSDCGVSNGIEQVEFKVVDKNRIPRVDCLNSACTEISGRWVGPSWGVFGRTGLVPQPCPAPPPPGRPCPVLEPETHEANLEWKTDNMWLGKLDLTKCSGTGPRYRSNGTDLPGLVLPGSC